MEDPELPKNTGVAARAELRSKGTRAHLPLPSLPLAHASPAPPQDRGPGLAAQPSASPPHHHLLALGREELFSRHFTIGFEYELSIQKSTKCILRPLREQGFF